MTLKLSKRIKLIERFIESYPHKLNVKSIKFELVKTYHGDYPSFTIEYEGDGEPKNKIIKEDEIISEITYKIKKFTNLSHSNDYWLSCEIL
jgi:hypothetical protein